MNRCANNKCDNDPEDDYNRIVVTIDGDFVCNKQCECSYISQRDNFFNNTVHDENACKEYLNGNN